MAALRLCELVIIGFYWFVLVFLSVLRKFRGFSSWRNFRPVRHGSFAALRLCYSCIVFVFLWFPRRFSGNSAVFASLHNFLPVRAWQLCGCAFWFLFVMFHFRWFILGSTSVEPCQKIKQSASFFRLLFLNTFSVTKTHIVSYFLSLGIAFIGKRICVRSP